MKHIVQQFQCVGNYVSSHLYGDGHINETYIVEMDAPAHKYILQKINHNVFKNVHVLMSNYEKVTTFMKSVLSKDQVFIELIPTIDNKPYLYDGKNYYRMITFIDHAIAYQNIPTKEHMYLAGFAFGDFQSKLAAFDAATLKETIPYFHHTPKRFDQLENAILKASKERLEKTQVLIERALAFKSYSSVIVDALEQGRIPTRVTHNDTKINNVLFDEDKLEVKCVVDLDTIMPGSLLYDFGDAIRFGCNTAKEDEANTDLINFNEVYFKAYTEGFLQAVKETITQKELDMLVDGALIMTLEVGIRFLTDYLENDIYFKIHYEEQNHVRAINQITYLECLKHNQVKMRTIVQAVWETL